MKVLLTREQLNNCISRLAQDIKLHHASANDLLLIGIQQGGVVVADRIMDQLKEELTGKQPLYGQLDITFYRDDIRKEILAPDRMNIPFDIENKTIILIDDVLFTGRTIKAALDALLDYGRPAKVELCVLVDRKEHRQFPIQADYVGTTIQTEKTDKVKLRQTDTGDLEVVLLPS
ncbi:MAG: bifunctional pyr operon transcriptional regulator/uracil phosphoribosyltransferase PyrR [Bacteroidetes bacterium]|nr:bifunctional pyr operon transcriptional regulator/uracil phosphoribosyltransferase PyrR [Bacteroidota bacterium]